jgi:putative methionine-R-sulfoxide reductase with GAF domain
MVQPEATDYRDPTAEAPSTYLDLRNVAAAMHSLSDDMGAHDRGSTLKRLVTTAVDRVPNASWASVSVLRSGTFTTGASTNEEASRADSLQYQIGSGPCVDAVLQDSVYVTSDVASDPRWVAWGQRAAAEVGVRSVLAQRLHLLEGEDIIAGLNIYSDQPGAFDEHAVGMGLVLATHAALALSRQMAEDRAENLMRALKSNREIGVAMGILMQQHHLTRDQAFDVLRVASQDSNRKLADIAADVADTGTLEIRRRSGSVPPQVAVLKAAGSR